MNYSEWEKGVPAQLKTDNVWKMESYRLALFLGDIAWLDITRLRDDQRTRSLADQLYRSCGSISANLSEGYSRRSPKDQTRLFEHALGSARECREWYYKAKYVLGEKVTVHRLSLLTSIIRLLLATIPKQRIYKVEEPDSTYGKSSVKLPIALDENVPLSET